MNRLCLFLLACSVVVAVAHAGDECPHHSPAGVEVHSQSTAQAENTLPAGNKFPIGNISQNSGTTSQVMPPRSGSLAIRAVQGTEGGPAIASVPVEIELYHRGMIIDTIKSELDEHGIAIIEDLPVAMGLQPVIKIFYADVTYQQLGDLMDRANPEQTVEIVCYELTDLAPPWKVRMRHVMIAAAPDGLHVTEVMAIENPTDRTWIGKAVSQDSGAPDRATTTEFTLPSGAMGVSLGRGFHDWCCTTLADGRLKNHLPLMPGTTEMIYGYVMPSQRGNAIIDIHQPADVDYMMVFVPGELDIVSISGLTEAGTDTMGGAAVRMYTAGGLTSGQVAQLSLAGLDGDDGAGGMAFAKTVAAIGIAVMAILVAGLIFRRPAKKVLPEPVPAAA